MERILELARECQQGIISMRTFRSRLLAKLSMLEDEETNKLIKKLLD